MTGSLIFFSNFKEWKGKSNSNYHMSINKRQAIQKSCIDRRSNAWLSLGSESETMVCDTLKFLSRLPVTVFKSLNDRQSEFRGSSEPIMYMIIVQYVNGEVSSDPKIISRIAVRSWHQSRDMLSSVTPALRGKFLVHVSVVSLHSDDRLSFRA